MADASEEKQGTTMEGAQIDKAKAQAWLQDHWAGSKQCPISDENNWVIGDHAVQPNTYLPGVGVGIGGPGYPVIMVICGGCGYTMYFNAVMIGVTGDSDGNE